MDRLTKLLVAAVALLMTVQVSAGVQHTCVVDQSRAVYCWGSNSSGQLGQGSSRCLYTS